MTLKPTSHCIHVETILDWVNRLTSIKLNERIQIPKPKNLKNLICFQFAVPCDGEKLTIWSGTEQEENVATFAINLKKCDGIVHVLVNGINVTSLTRGQSFSTTTTNLKKVEVMCVNAPSQSKACRGTFEMQIHSKQKQKCEIQKAVCFLSDINGNRLDTKALGEIKSNEICVHKQNRNVLRVLPDGNKQILQEIDVVLQGFITVQLLDKKEKVCKSFTIPFLETETFFLCAPEGTNIQCEITDVHCKSFIFPFQKDCINHFLLNIKLELCLSVYSLKRANLEIQAKPCHPRLNLESFKIQEI
ncbi:S-Ena type endospore appendage [Bacillus alveayuensis]|uniref:S-Ena type endospore appendage n=1 Tax=Aeribacillus alveayuensis TaxID=279215 RepID=UPI0005D0EFA8|nr:S-Ena type endospore appendage [Bacillus alveayuensis]